MRKLFTFILLLFSLILSATSYYVKNTAGSAGSDAANGDIAHPWLTINKVNISSFSAGDTIFFNKGDTWREYLVIPSSGNAGASIVFSSYGTGDDPIISGSNILTSWTTENIHIDAVAEVTANLALETFDAAGYDLGAAWTEALGTNCIADENSTDITDSQGGNSQILKLVKASTGWSARSYLRFQATPPPISYFQCYNNTTAEGLSTTNFIHIAWTSGGGNVPWACRLLKTDTTLTYNLKIYNNGTYAYYNSADLSLNTWYKIEVKWDLTNGYWEWRINGVSQNSGTLTGTLFGNPEYFFLGDNSASKTITTYYDNVKISSSGYPAPAIDAVNITVYKKIVDVQPNQMLADYVRLVENTTSKVSLAVGQFWWNAATDSVFVRLTGDANPADHAIQNGYRDRVMDTGSESYLTFNGITFEGCNSTSTPAISCAYAVPEYDIKFYNCTVQYNAGRGIRFTGGGIDGVHGDLVYNCIIRYNWMDGLYSSYAGDVTVENCQVYSNGLNPTIEGSGIYYKLGNWKIINCDIYDNGRRTTYAHGIYQYDTNIPVTITGCRIYSNPAGDGIRSSGSVIMTGNSIYDNYAEGCDFGVPNTANITYQLNNNLIYNNNHCQIILGRTSSGTMAFTAYNNTIYQNSSSATSAILVMVKVDNITLKNNIIYTANQLCFESRYVTDDITMISDYNIFYRADAGNKFSWLNVVKTFAQWQALGFDVNGLYGDPLFVSMNDFHLQEASPAKDAGTDVGLTTDYSGHAIIGLPDIGAYEYGYTTPPVIIIVTHNGVPVTHNGVYQTH